VRAGPAKILVVGSGGREHAIAWRLAADPEPAEILVAPGNPGIAESFRTLPLEPADAKGIAGACRAERIDLVVIGPDQPLADGLSDALSDAGIGVFGPSRAAARLEWSKSFAKERMHEAGVRTARAETFERPGDAVAALAGFTAPWVLKADGLAAGKGVCIAETRDQAEAFLRACFEEKRFGASGARVLIEEHLEGEEVSATAVCDGERHVLLSPARDHKRAFDGDRGPNTGGMGAYAPSPAVSEAMERRISDEIVTPMLDVMRARGTPFRGVLYAGLMLTPSGPSVLELNARFGDPETQVILPLLEGSLSALLAGAARGELDRGAVRRRSGCTLTVALVDEDYPAGTRGGGRIEGLDAIERGGRGIVFHAGTTRAGNAWGVRSGRAAYVTGKGRSIEEARDTVYAEIGRLGGGGWRYRRDIGLGVPARALSTGD
jgi:phosphoribosylamine--glycine ligase